MDHSTDLVIGARMDELDDLEPRGTIILFSTYLTFLLLKVSALGNINTLPEKNSGGMSRC